MVCSRGCWSLASDNPAYPPIPVEQYEAIDLFGVVTCLPRLPGRCTGR
nr:hypothetical protein [Pseudomonas aeruginosa]